jgi:hypothetical protein
MKWMNGSCLIAGLVAIMPLTLAGEDEKEAASGFQAELSGVRHLLGEWYRWKELEPENGFRHIEGSALRWTFMEASDTTIVMLTQSIYNDVRGDFATIEKEEEKVVMRYYRKLNSRR